MTLNDLIAENHELKALIERLAPHEPIVDPEYGDCVLCTGAYRGTRHKSTHAPGCPWVQARELLGDELPD